MPYEIPQNLGYEEEIIFGLSLPIFLHSIFIGTIVRNCYITDIGNRFLEKERIF